MPRLLHALPKYRRHRASGQAVVTLNGRDLYLGRYGTAASRAEYERLTGEWLASGRRPIFVVGSEVTITHLCRDYLKFAIAHYRANPKVMPGVKQTIRYLNSQYGPTLA